MTRGRRHMIVAGLLLAGWAFGQATVGVPPSSAAGTPVAATPTANGATSAAPATATPPPATRGNTDAPLLRFGLILMLGLALGSGAIVQYRATADAPPHQPKSRRQRRAAPHSDAARSATPAPVPSARTTRATTPTLPPATPAIGERTPVFSAFPRGGQTGPMPATQIRPLPLHAVEHAPRLTRAEERCADAIAAAYRYDRPGTLSAFGAALDADPTLKPSALPDFWEMPAGGHADLARAYLRREQRLDARSVVTMALLTFPHNRELTALLREIDPYRLDRPA